MNKQTILKVGVSIFVFVLIVIFGSPFFIVNPGQRSFIVRFGSVGSTIYPEGFYWKTPFIDNVVTVNIQTNKVETDATAASSDLQNVDMNLTVNYNISSDFVTYIYKQVGGSEDLANKVISPTIQETVKAATAKFTAEELITKRSDVSSEILTNLKEKLKPRGVNIEALNIINFKFSDGFDQSIEAKVQAEQDALTQKNKLEQVKYEAEQTVAQAEAQAKSIQIQAQAIQQQGGADYVKLKWVEKRDGKLPTTSLGAGQSFMINLQQ